MCELLAPFDESSMVRTYCFVIENLEENDRIFHMD